MQDFSTCSLPCRAIYAWPVFPVVLVPVTVVEFLDQAPAVREPDLDVGDGL